MKIEPGRQRTPVYEARHKSPTRANDATTFARSRHPQRPTRTASSRCTSPLQQHSKSPIADDLLAREQARNQRVAMATPARRPWQRRQREKKKISLPRRTQLRSKHHLNQPRPQPAPPRRAHRSIQRPSLSVGKTTPSPKRDKERGQSSPTRRKMESSDSRDQVAEDGEQLKIVPTLDL